MLNGLRAWVVREVAIIFATIRIWCSPIQRARIDFTALVPRPKKWRIVTNLALSGLLVAFVFTLYQICSATALTALLSGRLPEPTMTPISNDENSLRLREFAVLALQTATIGISVLLLILQSRSEEKRSIDAAQAATQAQSLAQINHTTSRFRSMERDLVEALLLWSQGVSTYSASLQSLWHDRVKSDVIASMVNRAVTSYATHNESDEKFCGIKAGCSRFVTAVSSPHHGIESLMESHAEILNAWPATQSYMKEMLILYEQLAVGVHRGSFRLQTIDRAVGVQLVDAYIRWQPFINLRRGRVRHRAAFAEFQMLASLIVRHRTSQTVLRSVAACKRSFLKRLKHQWPIVNITRESTDKVELIRFEYPEEYGEGHILTLRFPQQDVYWIRQYGRARFRCRAAFYRYSGELAAENYAEHGMAGDAPLIMLVRPLIKYVVDNSWIERQLIPLIAVAFRQIVRPQDDTDSANEGEWTDVRVTSPKRRSVADMLNEWGDWTDAGFASDPVIRQQYKDLGEQRSGDD